MIYRDKIVSKGWAHVWYVMTMKKGKVIIDIMVVWKKLMFFQRWKRRMSDFLEDVRKIQAEENL